MNNDEMVVKTVWKSAHAVRDWPGMVTIRRFSPFKNEKIEGEGATEADAWKNTADKIRALWKPEWVVDVITSEQHAENVHRQARQSGAQSGNSEGQLPLF
jgi:hypothetical protein